MPSYNLKIPLNDLPSIIKFSSVNLKIYVSACLFIAPSFVILNMLLYVLSVQALIVYSLCEIFG